MEDDGLLVVDVSAPAVSNVDIANSTLGHTDDCIKDGDAAIVTATVVDNEDSSAHGSDMAVVVIKDVLPSILVTKSADPTSLPEPGGMVEFTVRVDNVEAEPTYLVWLRDDVYGDITDVNNPRLVTTTCEP